MTIDLRDVRTQMLVVVGVLLLLSLAAIALLLSPAGRSRGAREQEYERLRIEKIEKTKSDAPVAGMDKKIAAAREEETEFNNERLAQHYSAMSEQLAHIAAEAGVNVSDVKYDQRASKGTPPGYDSVGITIQVQGSYEQDMRFINAVERQKMMLLIDAVSFGGMKGDVLTVSVHLSTFLRSAA
jgi:Tfp pilus assembly protein PilO